MTSDPTPAVLFEELTLEQAQQHLDAYLAGMTERISRLRAGVSRRGGPRAAALDGSPDSLERLWTWWRTAGVQRDRPEWTPDDPDLPIWMPHVRPAHYRGWSAAMLGDLDRIAGYAGAVILAADDTARWVVWEPSEGAEGGWHGRHEPVLVSRRVGRRNPRAAFRTMLTRELDPTTDPQLRRERVRLLLPHGVADDPPVQEMVEPDWSVAGLRIDVSPSWLQFFDLLVEVDERAHAVMGPEAFGALPESLAASEGVEEVIHPDNEELHLRTSLGREEVERIVRAALRTLTTAEPRRRAEREGRPPRRPVSSGPPRAGQAGEQALAGLFHRDHGRRPLRRRPVRDPTDPDGGVGFRVLDVLQVGTLEAGEAKVGHYPDAPGVLRQVDRDRILSAAGILMETSWHFYAQVDYPPADVVLDLTGEPAPPSRVGSVPSRPFDQLTRAEAQQHLDAHTARIPTLVAELRDDVDRRGGPLGRDLDGSPRSLDALWSWFLSRPPRDDPPWSVADADLPLWLAHLPRKRHDNWPGSLLRDLDRLAAYAATVILAADDTARWAVSVPPSGADVPFLWHHEPVIVSRRVGERNPRHQIGVFLLRARWLAGAGAGVPERLRLLLPDSVADDPPARPPTVGRADAVDDLEVTVGPPWEPPYTFTVWVDECADVVVGPGTLDDLETTVAAAQGVQDAAHVDREVLHVRTTLPAPAVEAAVRDALRTG